jgi:Lon-like ATP-dependent protease
LPWPRRLLRDQKLKVDNYGGHDRRIVHSRQSQAVGGVAARFEAAIQAGCTKIFIPKENWQAALLIRNQGLKSSPVDTLEEVLSSVLERK